MNEIAPGGNGGPPRRSRFLTEPEPARDRPLDVVPGVTRIVARNPSPMTYHGTNTYLFPHEGGTAVIDPGPDDATHVASILSATGGRVSLIIFTHRHRDHVGALEALKAATGAPVAGYADAAARSLTPDVPLGEGARIAGLTAVHTPGHASDHLCFARDDGILFSGDHVMSWNSSVVSPPDGSMAAFFASLERLLRRDDHTFLPGHGPPLGDPQALVQDLLLHRQTREAAILREISHQALTPKEIVARLYGSVEPELKGAAQRNVAAHLEKLRNEGRVTDIGDERWRRS